MVKIDMPFPKSCEECHLGTLLYNILWQNLPMYGADTLEEVLEILNVDSRTVHL